METRQIIAKARESLPPCTEESPDYIDIGVYKPMAFIMHPEIVTELGVSTDFVVTFRKKKYAKADATYFKPEDSVFYRWEFESME